MSTTDFVAPTYFINVLVSIDPHNDYRVTCSPAAIAVRLPDTVISYQIVETGGHDIRFVGMDHSPKHKNKHQLSAPAISPSGRVLTVVDANTSPEDLHIVLEFEDVKRKKFFHDPQVLNDPPPPPDVSERATTA